MKKALRSAEKKKKADADKAKKELEKKEREKKKKQRQEEGEKKKEFRQEDFLIKTPLKFNKAEEDFVFTDDESELFEDSKENLSEDEFLTPVPFKSAFGKRQAALSTSTPNLSNKKSMKRSASSPNLNEKPKKQQNRSLLPLKQRK